MRRATIGMTGPRRPRPRDLAPSTLRLATSASIRVVATRRRSRSVRRKADASRGALASGDQLAGLPIGDRARRDPEVVSRCRWRRRRSHARTHRQREAVGREIEVAGHRRVRRSAWPSRDRTRGCRRRCVETMRPLSRQAEGGGTATARADEQDAAPQARRQRTSDDDGTRRPSGPGERSVVSMGSHLSRLDHAGRCRSVRVRRRTASRCSGTRCSASTWSQSETISVEAVGAVHAGRLSRMSAPGRASASSAARIWRRPRYRRDLVVPRGIRSVAATSGNGRSR